MATPPVAPTNMYEDLEHSIVQALNEQQAKYGWSYPVLNKIDTKDLPNQTTALNIIRITDQPQPENGGGVKAVIRTPVDPQPDGSFSQFSVQDWPDAFEMMYQFYITSNVLQDVRNMEQLLRNVFRPQNKPLYLWDTVNQKWTDSYCNFHYAGYINRDVREDSKYCRVTNINFEVFNYSDDRRTEPAITQVPVLEFEIQTQN
jgi:hypothetical protein